MKSGNRIKTLNLADNLIGAGGGKALAKSLQTNQTLESLSLRLNRLTDDGASPVLLSLKSNTVLIDLNMSNNELGSQSSEAMSEALRVNSTLQRLYITGNMLAEEGGKALLDVMKSNTSLSVVDARCSGVDDVDIEEINRLLKQRVDSQKRIKEAEKETIMREKTDAAVADWKHRFYLGE